MIRLFIGIDLPNPIKKDLYAICYGLPRVKWMDEEQLHLTLRFIGEVDGGSVFTDIKDSLKDVRMNAFSIKLKRLGYFPPKKNPKVLWIGVEPREKITLLRNRVESVLVKIGLEHERRKFRYYLEESCKSVRGLTQLSLIFQSKKLSGKNPAYWVV
jgi:2'-5' RNA ligase